MNRFALRFLIAFIVVALSMPTRVTTGTTPSSDSEIGPREEQSGYSIFLPYVSTPSLTRGKWNTVAGNPQRTSWIAEEVSGNLRVVWYRPIEAYISQNVQLITGYGMIYVSTARGLYALDADDGQLIWRYDTQLPLGNSPSLDNGVVYVGGFDKKLHALNALTGAHLWSFDQAGAGFSTNPLVVEGKVLAGNRDGFFYAIGAHNTPSQGQLLWKFKTGGSIDISAAYQDGVVYFASNDNHAYALQADTGHLVWKSNKLPGDGYGSFWPVIYQDKVIFSAASGYRTDLNPGTNSVLDRSGSPYGKIFDMERDALFANQPEGAVIGQTVPNQPWANGKKVINVSRITEYLENNPRSDVYLHKPWRRVMIVLNRSDGSEYTFDSDSDGYREYYPVAMLGTHSGNRYPPVVGLDGILYQTNIYQNYSIPQGRVMGWNMGTPYMSVLSSGGAVDEPTAISAGGSLIYRVLCCDRVGEFISYLPSNRNGSVWTYSSPLSQLAPGYDSMWWGIPPGDTVRLRGNYGNVNGIYHNHGDQNPIIPYLGRLYVHRSNAVIAFGPSAGPGKLPLLRINPVTDTPRTISLDELKARLGEEIQKIIQAGHLRPGYYNAGQFARYTHLADYFDNPGDTLYTLARAYPYLSPALQEQTRNYLKNEFNTYFSPVMYARIGWKDGAAREAMPLPDDVLPSLANLGKDTSVDTRWSWRYPPHNFYALWQYARIIPEDAQKAYASAKSKLQVPVPSEATNSYLFERPFEHNAYIAGYIGFLRLQELAGMSSQDSQLRTQVNNELNRLLQLRATNFSKDTPYTGDSKTYHLRTLNISRNFIFLVPELGDYLNQHALGKVQTAVQEYNQIAPYWFVSRYNAVVNEGVRQNLYDVNALFLAKAYILRESRLELTKYLDAPAFERGDLLYIQNLIAAIEAP